MGFERLCMALQRKTHPPWHHLLKK
jgi:hypothetical protein